MTFCGDNRRLSRIGCGAEYDGNRVHCTIPADWSTRADGLCHETFATYNVFDRHVHWDGSNHRRPDTVVSGEGGRYTLRQDDRGIWHGHDSLHENPGRQFWVDR